MAQKTLVKPLFGVHNGKSLKQNWWKIKILRCKKMTETNTHEYKVAIIDYHP